MSREMIRADEFCESVRDGTHGTPKQTETGYRLVTGKHIKNGQIDPSEAYYISEKDYQKINERSLVEQWDVLMSMIGTVGEVAVVKDHPDYAITYSTSFTRIAEAGSVLFSVRAPVGRLNLTKHKIVIGRGLSAMNHKQGKQSYLFYLLKERFFKDNIVGNGAVFASISKDELLGQIFLVPTDGLIERFNSVVAEMDSKIQALDAQIDLLSEARDRLLPKLMSGEVRA